MLNRGTQPDVPFVGTGSALRTPHSLLQSPRVGKGASDTVFRR